MNKENIKTFIKINYKKIIIVCLLIVVAEIVIDIYQDEIMLKDVIGYKLISKYLINDKVTPIAKIITNFGGAIYIFILATTLFILIKDKLIGFFIYLNIALTVGLNQLLKNIVQRPRPLEYRIIDESGYSFPSGHSMVSAAFYGFLIYLIYKKVNNIKLRNTLMTLLVLLILLIGISRIYLGVHYTSDVIAGFLISICYLIIFISIIDNYIFNK